MANLAGRLKARFLSAGHASTLAMAGARLVACRLRLAGDWSLRRKWITLAATAGMLAAIGLVLSGGQQPTASATGPSIFTVNQRPLIRRLSLVGTVEPGGIVNVIAPFDGAIKEKLIDFGVRVEKGQALLVLDTSEIELQMREAEAASIKAEGAMRDMQSWGTTPEVMRARNAMIAARMKVDELERKEHEDKTLLSRGIIPRVEYDGVAEQLKAQQLQFGSAKQELEAALKRGDSDHRLLAALELETAHRRLAELKRRMDAGLVEAPTGGLLLRPAASSDSKGASSPAEIEIGSRVTKGQPMFTVADTATLKIVAQVDEIDVNRVSEGMAVQITGDAFGSMPLTGRVVRVSAQAASGAGASGGRSAAFEVMVAVPSLPESQQGRVRVGMSAALSIIMYENAAAIVVPTAAIHQGGSGAFALVRDHSSGRDRSVAVVTGRSTEDGVEILEGLAAGDAVVIDPSRTSGVPSPSGTAPLSEAIGLGGGR
ncbi:HlyD family efflux transporter periplasmic adaptor subunit [Magnetospirillum sp. 15-1]|uniref:efflux RND transporter periplasmic adaptor subunit n=1 Tax=Magnetospirillum sp. 15-1 TaxID=1979370 RepID=UPI000BBBCC7E|nr:HlyD family efflux transporter periplasmic adaptor subunit [Magnetospirillum sp. 15-1]